MSGGKPVHSLERDIAAWLETVAAGSGDTIQQSPGSTIVPGLHAPDTAGRRALAVIQQLSRSGPTASAQLTTGETIGEGGMGVVRLGEQVALGRTVAIKTLKPDRRDDATTLDLLREAWVTGSLEHPNVVPVYSIGLAEDGSPLIVLKRIEGVDWAELMHDPEQVRAVHGEDDLLAWNLGILMQVLNALRFAHSRGIIHRDLKPENVMIGEFGEVYLVDWGIAVSLRDDPSGRMPLASDATEMAGTPCYMAPEMLGEGRGLTLSERTDVYLAGAVLYEIMTGRPPHLGDSALEVLTSVATSQPELPDDAPPELARICRRAMAPEPSGRFASAGALHHALQQYLQHRGSEQLAARAAAGLEPLARAIAADTDDPAGKREEVYRLYGACRFGFHEALSSWRDNPEARAGLARATCAVAELELAEGDPRHAVRLLAELDDPPAELVDRTRAAAAEADRRAEELDELARKHDWTTGTRTRSFMAGLLGLGFTGFPLAVAVTGQAFPLDSHRAHIAWALGCLLFIVGLGYWARESMTKTVINQRVFLSICFLFLAQAILWIGLAAADIPVAHGQPVMMFGWMSVAAMFAINVDRRLAPTAAGYVVAFLVAARWPHQQYYAMAAANFVFLVNAVWVWRPKTIRMTAEERAALGRPPRR
jgi:serine/threonine-protein kinase